MGAGYFAYYLLFRHQWRPSDDKESKEETGFKSWKAKDVREVLNQMTEDNQTSERAKLNKAILETDPEDAKIERWFLE